MKKKSSNNNNYDYLKFLGDMDEDEALAKALAESEKQN